MENYKVVRTIIKNHPDILNNRQKLRSTLLDYFPNEKLSVNMFLMAYDEGLLSKIENLNLVDELMFQGFVNALTADYGVTYETAHNVVKMAAGTLDKLVQEPEMPVAPDTTASPVFPEKKSKAPVKKRHLRHLLRQRISVMLRMVRKLELTSISAKVVWL